MKKYLEEILGWMQGHYEGDIIKTSGEATEYAKAKGYISGILWDEIGARTLKIYFNERMRFGRQDAFIGFGKEREAIDEMENQTKCATPLSVYVMWYNLPDGTAVCLGDMTKSQCSAVAEDYRKRERQNRKYAMVFEKISKKLYNKKVKEVFTEPELEEMFAVVTKVAEYPLLDEVV